MALPFDFSTLNLAELRKLPMFELPGGWSRQRHPGGGCFTDPPGFPTYYTRSIYTGRGDEPRSGPDTIIEDPETGAMHALPRYEGRGEELRALMAKLYVRLPFEHPRVQAWVSYLFGYFRNCYEDPAVPMAERAHAARLLIPKAGAPRPPPETHRAMVRVREPYPEVPVADLERWINAGRYGGGGPGDWWERHAERPSAEDCPGLVWMQGNTGHRAEGWCQFCGRVDGKLPGEEGAEP